MRIVVIIFLLVLSLRADKEFVDGIAFSCAGEQEESVVFFSDVWFLSALGMPITLEEKIIKTIWLSYGADRGIKISADGSSNEYAEQYLDALQEKRGITRDFLNDMAKKAGHSLADIKNELNEQYLLQQIIELTLSTEGCLYVSDEKIQKFCEENPLVIPESYTLQHGTIERKKYNEQVPIEEQQIAWKTPYVVAYKDLSESFKKIRTFKENTVVDVVLDPEEVCVYRLLKKTEEREASLEERYEEVQRTLQQEQYKSGYKERTLQLLAQDFLWFSSESLKQKCCDFVAQL